MTDPQPFLSGPPEVILVNRFDRPFENALATARTCYSGKGIVWTDDISGVRTKDTGKRAEAKLRGQDDLALSIYEAGHHTTLQHAHFQFALDRVSRQFLWTFLHSHPFYNSEQVSQRYVEVKPGNCAVPPLEGEARGVYERCLEAQMVSYHRLIDFLTAPVAAEYYARFPARRASDRYEKDVRKKAQEIARYVLPVATFAYLYHTVSGLTLLRYWRACEQYDAPRETRQVVQRMIDLVLDADPRYRVILEDPSPLEASPEARFLTESPAAWRPEATESFKREFDAQLDGRVSRLVDWKANAPQVTSQAVREVLGLPANALSDQAALELLLHPARNPVLSETMNLTTLSKLSRCLHHPSYTFRKKLSHTADSQDQRHRMTPASRPCLLAHVTEVPDYVEPALLQSAPDARAEYRETMLRSWDAFARLRALGVSREFACYLLPNAWAVRLTESSDLLNLHHKHKMRLCYNAQEEIWRASLDEQQAISEVHPAFGRYLLPPCGVRFLGQATPYCPEGVRYCGVPVWKLPPERWVRII